MKLLVRIWVGCLALLALLACSGDKGEVLRVGVIAGPESELLEIAAQVAANEHGLKVQVIEFEDFISPNTALVQGSIDANVFQHQPYLSYYNEHGHQNLVAVARTFVYPMAVYSGHMTRLDQLPQNAKIAIPDDPSNAARALLLLESGGLIELRPSPLPSVHDIVANPKNLRLIELDAALLPRALNDVAAAAINTVYAMPAGLIPNRDGLLHEDAHSAYANVMVVRKEQVDDPKIRLLMEAIQSEPVEARAATLFGQQAIRAW